jgi:hypothetical protein
MRDCDLERHVKEAGEGEGSGTPKPPILSRLFFILCNRRNDATFRLMFSKLSGIFPAAMIVLADKFRNTVLKIAWPLIKNFLRAPIFVKYRRFAEATIIL